MKNTLLKVIIAIASLAFLIILAGIIKFNFLDIPYLGDPITYQTDSGKTIVVSKRVDESIILDMPNDHRTILEYVKSGSGEKYLNTNKSLIFWRKGKEFFIKKSGEIIFRGQQLELQQ